jgi:hypothetical protein
LQLILTGKEIESLYRFYQSRPASVWAGVKTNIVIKQGSTGIGNFTHIQTQEDFWENKDTWEDITDYEAW